MWTVPGAETEKVFGWPELIGGLSKCLIFDEVFNNFIFRTGHETTIILKFAKFPSKVS